MIEIKEKNGGVERISFKAVLDGGYQKRIVKLSALPVARCSNPNACSLEGNFMFHDQRINFKKG